MPDELVFADIAGHDVIDLEAARDAATAEAAAPDEESSEAGEPAEA